MVRRLANQADKYAQQTHVIVEVEIKESVENTNLGIVFGHYVYEQGNYLGRSRPPVAIYPLEQWDSLVIPNTKGSNWPITAVDFEIAGLTSHYLGDPDGAIHNYQRALEKDPGYVNALTLLGQEYIWKDQINDAVVCLEKAVRIKPDNQDSWLALALAYNVRGEWNITESLMSCLDRMDQGLGIVDNHEAWCEIGESQLDYMKYNIALLALQRALISDSTCTRAMFNLGIAFQYGDMSGQEAKAIPLYEKVIEAVPGHLEALYEVGQLYLQRGDASKAATCYESILAIDSLWYRADWARYYLAVSYAQNNELDLALDQLYVLAEISEGWRAAAAAGSYRDFPTVYMSPEFQAFLKTESE